MRAYVLLACGLGTTVNALFNVVSLVYDKKILPDAMFPATAGMVGAQRAGRAGVDAGAHHLERAVVGAAGLRGGSLEAALCAVGLVGGTMISFDTWFVYGIQQYPLAYLPYPFLAWAALRFGPRGAAAGTLLVAALAILSLLQKRGPFVTGSELDSLRLVGSYIGIVAVSNLLLAAAASERRRALADVVENEKRLRTVMADQTDLICRFQNRRHDHVCQPGLLRVSRQDRRRNCWARIFTSCWRRRRRPLAKRSRAAIAAGAAGHEL